MEVILKYIKAVNMHLSYTKKPKYSSTIDWVLVEMWVIIIYTNRLTVYLF